MHKAEKRRVLVVDDSHAMADMVADGLNDVGFQAVALASSSEAMAKLKTESFDAMVTDLRMPETDGLALLRASKALNPDCPVLVMTAYGAIDTAISAIREGAYHYLTKPFKVEELILFLERAIEESALRIEASALRYELRERYSLSTLVSASEAMRRVVSVVERIAPTDVPILLLGETGTGKGHIAHAIHALSPRASHRLVTLNCAALPESLLESELFGHAKGAFTGATTSRPGLFADADEGTLFLDEIAEMSPAVQAKLLRVLETGRVRALGESEERQIDVRIIAATHRDLRARTKQGQFREDLLYRLEVMPIVIPPLRERRQDIVPLVHHYLVVARNRHPSSLVARFSEAALEFLRQFDWPGNVRELAHVVERAVLLGEDEELSLSQVQRLIIPLRAPNQLMFDGQVLPLRELHRQYAEWVLEKTDGQRGRAAELLGIDVKTLRSWLANETS